MEVEMSKTTKAHARYRLKPTEQFPKGEIVPGVTTIIDSQLGWNKRVLMAWARREALAGRDPDKILSQAGDIGGAVHTLIEAHVKSLIQSEKVEPDLSKYTAEDIDKAETAFLAFLDWEKGHKLTYLESEKQVVSEMYRYGGTIDILAQTNGVLWLIDPKSSKGIYNEFILQVVAYDQANMEMDATGKLVDEIHLLHLGKQNGEFSDLKVSPVQREIAWESFKHCRRLYDLQKRL